MVKLIIVDDEPLVRNGLAETFDWNGHDVEIVGIAANGIEAVGLIEEVKPDIVLADIRMPGKDGLELACWIRDNYPQISVILLSGYSDFEYAKNAIEFDVMNYLLKPVEEEELFHAIEKSRKKLLSALKIEQQSKELKLLKDDLATQGEKLIDKASGAAQLPKETDQGNIAQEVKQYIENHFHENINLKTVATIFAVNSSYLSRIFSAETGLSFTEYITECRINQAKELLRNSNYTIFRISSMSGYNNEKYFSRLFKKRQGVTPQEYRISVN